MFWEILKFDARQQLKTPLLWIGTGFFALMAFAAASSDAVTVGGAIGNINRNAPSVIVNFYKWFSFLAMFLVAAFISDALLRDFELRTSEMFFSTPMKKAHYIWGRFSGVILASLAIFLFVGLGMMLGAKMPWVDAARMGPTQLWPHLWSFGVIVLPNLLFIAALLGLLAVTTRSMLYTYLGVVALLVLYTMAGTLMRDIQYERMASLLDPFGFKALERTFRYWSAVELNAKLPPMNGLLLANRLLWAAVSLALLTLTQILFKPQTLTTPRRWFRKKAVSSEIVMTEPKPIAVLTLPVVTQLSPLRRSLNQLFYQFKFDTAGIFKGIPFLIMLAFGLVNLLMSNLHSSGMYGTRYYPVTVDMLESVQGSFNFMLVFIVAFYSGELVWKERSVRISEVMDAMPVPDWVPLLSKTLGVVAVVWGFMAIGALTGVSIQLAKGFTDIEPMLYAKGLLLSSIPFVLMGLLSMAIQVLVNHKFLGYMALLLVVVAQMTMDALHFEHNLYTLLSAPSVTYSDMNGYGHYLPGRLWFQLYWFLFTFCLLLAAKAFWVRGSFAGFKARFAQAKSRMTKPMMATGLASLGAFGATGAWIFHNTNILNHYVASDKRMDLQANFEKTYAHYKNMPQPRILDVKADVDIYPETQSLDIRGHYRLQNKTDKPIHEFLVQLNSEVELKKLDFARSSLVKYDKDMGLRIYKLSKPMQPGAFMDFHFELHYARKGFTNSGSPININLNGTFFNNQEFFPGFGYKTYQQLTDRHERRKRGLPEPERMAKLEDERGRQNSDLTNDADWINFETTVSTSADQVALSPGYLMKEWTQNGRRYFHYKMDSPMMPFFAYLSAKWEVKRDSWNGLPIEVYYDKKHPWNVDRMIEGVKCSLDYFTKNFGPYQHKQVRILEFPRYQSFAQSFPNTIPYSESIGFIADLRDKESLDYVFTIASHELAHQWWGHQVCGGDQQGATMLSEALAEYSSLMVMEKAYGKANMRRYLKYELDRYLSGRGREALEEQPLYRVENQQYIHYRKGAHVFYRLRDEIGEETLNRVLAKFIKDKAFQYPPYPTSKEFMDYLRAEVPADKHGLISDLLEKIVFYDNRAVDATARKLENGKYEVELAYEARKIEVDGKGNETDRKLDEWVDVGVFARKKGESESKERVLYFEKHPILKAKGTIKIVVDEMPFEAGLDPYNKMIDRVSDDNRKKIDVK